MPKKISDRQRIITYASQVDETALTEAIETLQAIKAGRFPRPSKKQARSGKAQSRQAIAKAIQPDLPTNGDEEDAKPRPRRKQQDKFQPDPEVMKIIEESKHEASYLES